MQNACSRRFTSANFTLFGGTKAPPYGVAIRRFVSSNTPINQKLKREIEIIAHHEYTTPVGADSISARFLGSMWNVPLRIARPRRVPTALVGRGLAPAASAL